MSIPANVMDKIVTARVGMLMRAPFFGNMATRFKIIDGSEWCNTAATNGRNIYVNVDFFTKLTVKKIEFVLAHEVLHCVLDHFGRLGLRNRKLANIAQDYAVNQILADEKIGEIVTEIPICLDSKYRGMPWEQIYDILYENAEKIDLDDYLKQLGELLDEHIQEGAGGEGGSQDKDGSGKPTLTKNELQEIRDELREAMVQAANAAGAGKTPAAIQRMIKDLTEPKLNWRQLVQQEIQSIVRNDYSFSRPNRKSCHSGAILPGMREDTTIDVAVVLDMSGSISDHDGKVFLSEVKGVLDQYTDFIINILCFDTEIYNHRVINQDNSYELLEYQPQGGGGTDFMCVWNYFDEIGLNPKKVLFFTDGYPCGEWGPDNAADTLWIVKGNKNAQAPFGTTVIYENEV